jgi:hypothetical protein
MKLSNLLKEEGYKLAFEGYDYMSTWVVLEKNNEKYYYYLNTETLEKIEVSKELKWDEFGNLLEECK